MAGRHTTGQWHATGRGASDRAGWHARVQVVCGGGDAKRAAVVAGWHATGRGGKRRRGVARESVGGKGGGGRKRRGPRPINVGRGRVGQGRG